MKIKLLKNLKIDGKNLFKNSIGKLQAITRDEDGNEYFLVDFDCGNFKILFEDGEKVRD